MVKTHGSTVLKAFALFAALSGGVITLTDAMSSQVNAEESAVASVAVESACSFGVENTEHADTIAPGNNTEDIGGNTIFTINCNDMNGYVVYAVGYSDDDEGTTAMIGSGTAEGNTIATGTAISGSASNWSYKVQLTSSDTNGIVLPTPNSAFMTIPDTRTAVMQRETGLPSDGDKYSVSYAVYVSDTQVAGTYTGKVKYILFQPHSHGAYPLSMQKVTEWIDTVNPGDTITVMDERDGNTYRVRRLADGKLWMVDNLRLGDSKLKDRTLTSANTDLNDGQETYDLPESSKDGFQTGEDTAENIYVVEADDGNEKEIYGGYYTYNAATAGTGANTTSFLADAPSSICPKGWRLPTGGSSGEFKVLNDKLGGITNSDANLINPTGPAFLRSGYCWNGSVYNQGSSGPYWSSTSGDSHNAYFLNFYSTAIYPSGGFGRYNGISVRCVARDPSIQYGISYNLNGGSGGPSPNPQEGATRENTITLDSKKPTKSGFAFQYWCSASNTSDSTTCSGTHYDAGATYTLSSGANTTLYAVWQPTIQNWTGCSGLSIGGTVTLEDSRDGNTYRVRKLADGKCWMIDNLRLGDSKLTNRTLTSANTDLNNDLESYDLPENSKNGFTLTPDAYDSVENVYVVETDSGDEKEIYGGYYTWNAATAGTGENVFYYQNAPSSICPKGWKLPTSINSSEFSALNQALGGITNSDEHLINPAGPAFLPAGYYSSGSAYDQGSSGYYWSSTSGNNRYACYMIFRDTYVSPESCLNRQVGFSVRCLAR